jgi:hypothetical protein
MAVYLNKDWRESGPRVDKDWKHPEKHAFLYPIMSSNSGLEHQTKNKYRKM